MKRKIEIEKTAASTFKERLTLLVMVPIELFFYVQLAVFMIGVLVALTGYNPECTLTGKWGYALFGFYPGCKLSHWLTAG